MSDKATLDLVLDEVKATRVEVQGLSQRMAVIEAHQRNVPTLAQHEVLAGRLAWHEQTCADSTARMVAYTDELGDRIRDVEERAPKRPQQLGAAAGAGGVVAGIIELVRHLASLL